MKLEIRNYLPDDRQGNMGILVSNFKFLILTVKVKIIVLLLLLILIIVASIKVYKLKSESIASPSGRLNIAVYGKKAAWLIAIDTKGSKGMHGVMIPGKIYIESAHGAGKYPTAKLRRLGELEGDVLSFIGESLESFMQMPVDGVVISDRLEKNKDLKNIIRVKDIIGNRSQTTDLNTWDRFIVWKTLQVTVLTKEEIIDISETRAVHEDVQADGAKIIVAEVQLLPIKIRQFFVEPLLADEKINVTVYNATRTMGLAQIVGNIIESTGINVVKLDNADRVLEKCEIRTDSEAKNSKSFQRLLQVFDCRANQEKPKKNIGDIEVYIGEEYSRRMFGR